MHKRLNNVRALPRHPHVTTSRHVRTCTCHPSLISLLHYDSVSACWTCIIHGVMLGVDTTALTLRYPLGHVLFVCHHTWACEVLAARNLSLSHLVCISFILDPNISLVIKHGGCLNEGSYDIL